MRAPGFAVRILGGQEVGDEEVADVGLRRIDFRCCHRFRNRDMEVGGVVG